MRRLTVTLPWCLASLLATSIVQAEQPAGWKWYNEPAVKVKKALTPPPPPAPAVTVTRTLTPTEQMDWFHRYHKDATNDAAINSKDNKKVEKVQLLNKFLYDKSSEFGMTMQENLLLNPSLSYTKDRPTEQAARSTYLQMEREKKIRAVRELAEAGWGIVFCL